MIRRSLILTFILVMGLSIMVKAPSTSAQGAKIQRKTAQLTVQPQVILRGNQLNAIVQIYDDSILLRVHLIRIATGESIDCQQLKGSNPIQSISLSAPEETEGQLRVVLEARRDLEWTPIASLDVQFYPKFWDDLRTLFERIKKIEIEANESNPSLLRAAWATLAFAEDLMERAKTSEAGDAWDAQRRLVALRTKTEFLEGGKDPLADTPGYQLHGYRSPLDGEIQLYSMYLPKDYGVDPNRKWPLVVMLHGAWSNHHLALRRVMGISNSRGEDDPSAKRYMPALPDVPYIVAAPNGFETSWYKPYAEDDAWRVIDEVTSQFNIDPNRIYLTGLSMGGMGTGMLGLQHPDRFAAIAPVCGFFAGPFESNEPPKPAYLKRFVQCAAPVEVAENAFQLPVKLMHGEEDPIVPVQFSIEINAKLKELGYRTEIEVYPGVGHDAWVPAYENARIFDWFSQFERNPAPPKVVFKTGDPQGGSSYWVHIEEPMKIRQFARIEANIVDGTVSVKTDNIQRFSLTIPESLITPGTMAKIIVDDKAVYDGTFSSTVRFLSENGEWNVTRDEVPRKLLPSKNGLFAALYDRHVFAYGTAGNSLENETARTLAVNQAMPDSWVDALFPVLPENALTPDVLKDNHIVLVSTLTGSSFLQNCLKALPITVEGNRIAIAGRSVNPDRALALIVPNPSCTSRYLLIYTSATLEGLRALQGTPNGVDALFVNPPGDFVIFGRDGKPVWGGLFDKNWTIEETGDF